MEYSKQLIQKAKGKPCQICYKAITEIEADACEFECTRTQSRREVFIHSKCWSRHYGMKVLP